MEIHLASMVAARDAHSSDTGSPGRAARRAIAHPRIDPREVRKVLLHSLERAPFRRQAAPAPVARVGILP
jgi:hypothetical protein